MNDYTIPTNYAKAVRLKGEGFEPGEWKNKKFNPEVCNTIILLDSHDQLKQDRSRSFLRTIQDKNNGVISTQIMQEFYVVATKRLSVKPQIAKNILHSFENFEVVQINPPLIQQAIDCSIIHQLSFWDAPVIVSAESAKCDQLWTEDLNSGQVIRGVIIDNPINLD